MKIFIANPTKTLVRSTDHDYLHTCFVSMQESHNIEFCVNKSIITRFHRDAVYIKNRILSKVRTSRDKLIMSPYNEAFYVNVPASCDLVFSYGGFPIQLFSSMRRPVICEQTYAYGGRMDFKVWKEYLIRNRKFYVERADLLVTPSVESLNCFRKVFPQYENKIVMIPYYLPYLKAIGDDQLKDKFATLEKIRLLFVGKEAKRKGLDKLIEAFGQLPPGIQERFEVTVVSKFVDGKLDLPDSFIYKSYVENITEEFHKAHVLVFLTKQEAYGLVLVEAMASGCAILTTDHPIQRSILNNTGAWFVDPFDTLSIREKLMEIATATSGQLFEMGMANVSNFETDKSPGKVGLKYFELFSRAMR